MYGEGHLIRIVPLAEGYRIGLIYRVVYASACEHARTQIIARRNGVDYVECLDCRQIFEAEDLEPLKADDEEE